MAAIRTEALAHPSQAAGHEAIEWTLMALSTALAVGGILFARSLYLRHPERAEAIRVKAGSFYTILVNKWYLDEIYDAVFVRGLALGGGRLLAHADRNVVDGGVNGAGWLTKAISTVSIWVDTYLVDGVVRLTAFATRIVSIPVRLLQSGSVQGYALVFVIGVIILFGIYGRVN
jgi:NADH-quinone oxidoreductase subunit L